MLQWPVSDTMAIFEMCLLLVTQFIASINASLVQTTESRDYCETDVFEPNCDNNSVVVMTTARYGRMRIGSCVRRDLGYIGCQSDVMSIADARCSGRLSCRIRVPDPELDQTKPCLEELKTYLETSYQCVRVELPQTACSSSTIELSDSQQQQQQKGGTGLWSITRSAGTGYLVNGGADDRRLAGCGTQQAPLRINVQAGQRLNITVYDFSYGLNTNQPGLMSALAAVQPEVGCNHFIVLSEPDIRRRVKVCPSSRRMRTGVYISTNRSIELYFERISTQDEMNDQRFLVQFNVIGCSDIVTSRDMWFNKKNENEAEVGCRLTEQRWRLSCVDNRWHGNLGNCSIPTQLVATDEDLVAQLSHGTAIGVVLCVALLMGLVVLVIGALGLLVRRLRPRYVHRSSLTANDCHC